MLDRPDLHLVRVLRTCLIFCCLLAIAACRLAPAERAANVPTASPAPPALTMTAPPPPQPSADPVWRAIHPGLAWRTLAVPPATVRVLRIDPAKIRLRVLYDPRAPKLISAWSTALDALAVVNGAYFEASNEASALTISDGVVTGRPYVGFGGMLAVTNAGEVTLRSLVEQPYQPNEPLVQALQSFPRLVGEGHARALPNDNGQTARRTVVATDQDGHLLLLVVDHPQWTLTELGRWLERSELGIAEALNLDGGPSTGLAVRTPVMDELLDSETPVPQVLVLEAR